GAACWIPPAAIPSCRSTTSNWTYPDCHAFMVPVRSKRPSLVTSQRRASWPAVPVPFSACLSMLLSIVALCVSPISAAKISVASAQRPVTSPEARARLQRILEQNAPVLEAQATVLKTVAKLIGPTVVHIEADVPQRTLEHNLDRHVEEAGSGVIIE